MASPAAAATAYYLAACVVSVAGLSVVLQRRAGAVFGAWPWRVGLFGLLVLLPTAAEIQGNIANLHWWLTGSALVLLALPVPTTRPGRAAELAWLALVSLTLYSALLAFPVAVWGVWRQRSAMSWARLGVLTAGGLLQLVLLGGADRPRSLAWLTDHLATSIWLVVKRIGGGLALGDANLALLWPVGAPDPGGGLPSGSLSWWLVPATAMLLALGALAVRDWRGPSPAWVAAGLLALAAGFTSIPVGVNGLDIVVASDPAVLSGGGRYFSLGVMAGVLVLARGLYLSGWARTVATVGLACTLVAVSGDARLPAWWSAPPEVFAAFDACVERRTEPCVLPIAPEGWVVRVDPVPPR